MKSLLRITLLLLCVILGAYAQSPDCPDCQYYALFLGVDGNTYQRGRATIADLTSIHDVLVDLDFLPTTGEEACTTYSAMACGSNAVCTPGSAGTFYYSCNCLEGNYNEIRQDSMYTCEEIPTTATIPTTTTTPTTALDTTVAKTTTILITSTDATD